MTDTNEMLNELVGRLGALEQNEPTVLAELERGEYSFELSALATGGENNLDPERLTALLAELRKLTGEIAGR